MSDASDSLDYFGRFIVKNLRDRALADFALLAEGHWKAPALKNLQEDLRTLSPEHLAITRRAVKRVIDSAIHDLLFALQEESDSAGRLDVRVDGRSVAEISDGLHGEPYSGEGWFARFSEFGEPPERA
jgi:hypothetical protein